MYTWYKDLSNMTHVFSANPIMIRLHPHMSICAIMKNMDFDWLRRGLLIYTWACLNIEGWNHPLIILWLILLSCFICFPWKMAPSWVLPHSPHPNIKLLIPIVSRWFSPSSAMPLSTAKWLKIDGVKGGPTSQLMEVRIPVFHKPYPNPPNPFSKPP